MNKLLYGLQTGQWSMYSVPLHSLPSMVEWGINTIVAVQMDIEILRLVFGNGAEMDETDIGVQRKKLD